MSTIFIRNAYAAFLHPNFSIMRHCRQPLKKKTVFYFSKGKTHVAEVRAGNVKMNGKKGRDFQRKKNINYGKIIIIIMVGASSLSTCWTCAADGERQQRLNER